jgi:hypothetical protein
MLSLSQTHVYRLRDPLPVGKYVNEALELEHLQPDGNTILAPQLGRFNPGPVLSLLALLVQKYKY